MFAGDKYAALDQKRSQIVTAVAGDPAYGNGEIRIRRLINTPKTRTSRDHLLPVLYVVCMSSFSHNNYKASFIVDFGQ